jgi:hypothetical protein
MTRTRRAGIVAGLATLLLVTACGPSGNTQTRAEIKTQAEVESAARAQAETVAGLAGGQLVDWRTSTAACQGSNGETGDDGRWSLSGFAHITLAADRHVAALRTIHDRWQRESWEIKDYRTLSDGVRGTLSGHDPASGLSVSLTSSDPPVQLAVIIGSACYQAAAQDPGPAGY